MPYVGDVGEGSWRREIKALRKTVGSGDRRNDILNVYERKLHLTKRYDELVGAAMVANRMSRARLCTRHRGW